MFSVNEDCGICIFGAGGYGKQSYYLLKILQIKIDMFADNDSAKWGEIVVGGIRCYNPKHLLNDKKLLVIVAIKNYAEIIASDLRKTGFSNIVMMSDIEGALNSKVSTIIDEYGVDLVKYMAMTGVGTDKCMENDCLPVPVHFYQPIPDLRSLERRDIWRKISKLDGIVWEPDKYLANLRELANYTPAQSWARNRTADPMKFNLENTSFSYMCASVLYGMIRKNRPKRIIEIGSGNSSKVIRQALLDNADKNSDYSARYTIIDPYCAFDEAQFHDVNGKILKIPVEESDISLFTELEENDILFIDSSHTVRIGGDVNFEILEILPILCGGVAVHFHDISLPYEYPRVYATNPAFRMFWTESYLLQAFLAFNQEYEILLPLAFLENEFLRDVRSCFPAMEKPVDWSSGSFWIRGGGGIMLLYLATELSHQTRL
jgi:hypothetical protein